MRRWVIGLLTFLFFALTVFSIILGKQIKEVEKTHQSFLQKPTPTIASVHSTKRH